MLWDQKAFLRIWLDAWSETMDAYLRSPVFLELMQRGLATLLDPGAMLTAASGVRAATTDPNQVFHDRGAGMRPGPKADSSAG
jgi:hypothetical protein